MKTEYDQAVDEAEDVAFEKGVDLDLNDGSAQKDDEPAEQPINQIEILVSKDPKVWEIGPEGAQRTFIQKELSFIGKMQWFSLIGDALDKALSGPNGISVNAIFSAPASARAGTFTAADFADADTFVQAVSKLLSAAPHFLVDPYRIDLK